MVLGWDFVFSSSLWLSIIFSLIFIFREPIKKLIYGKRGFNLFLSKLKTYLEKTYPDIKFDYSIIEKSKNESNPDTRVYLIVDDIIDQYMKLELKKEKFPKPITKDLQWGSYTFNCEPNRDKLPKDWMQRKNALLLRDNKKCFRCSKKVDINSVQVHMIRSLNEGGKYYLENLLPVCKDCEKILTNKVKNLDIKDALNDIAKEK